MKTCTLLLLFFFFSTLLLGQEVAKSTFATGGGTLSNGTETISFTFGEPIIDLVGFGPSIDQGFWASVVSEEVLTIEISPFQSIEIAVYPNPMDNHFYISTNSDSDLKIEIHNILGQQILTKTLLPSMDASLIDSSLWASGVYLLSVSVTDSDIKKIIKLLKN